MKGFLSLEPDPATRARLHAAQNRLRDGLTRQGVHFPDRLGAVLLAWPFARFEELDEALALLRLPLPPLRLAPLRGAPNDDRPAEIGFAVGGADALQAELFSALRTILDPDPPKPPFLRLARVSPPSRKVGAALRGTNLLGRGGDLFVPEAFAVWNQTPHGFEVYRTMRGKHGGP